MLSYLKITNYALIEESEIDFSGGFTVVTGESGAGKSIVMSAIELLCGGRGGKQAIRTGCDRCTLSGIFTIPGQLENEIAALLYEAGVEPENGELTLRRVISASSIRNFINDTPVNSKLLTAVGFQQRSTPFCHSFGALSADCTVIIQKILRHIEY